MGNSLRCCLACVLPCGALDVVRVVHLSGHLEEFSRPVTAGEIMGANPNHIITKPSSQGDTHRILIVSPESILRRGSIYFLIPQSTSSLQEKRSRKSKQKRAQRNKPCRKTTTATITTTTTTIITSATTVEVSDGGGNLTEVVYSEKKPAGHRRRRSGTVAVWQPRLESITEDL